MHAYRLRVDLHPSDIEPPIWRRIEISANATLLELHWAVQSLFGWENSHLHEFSVGDRSFSDPEFGLGRELGDEGGVTLADVAEPGDELSYVYDFGDDWRHRIAVEGAAELEPGDPVCRLVDGARAAPIEDCGGLPGYLDLVDAMADPDAADPELLEWAASMGTQPFAPDRFDVAATAAAMTALGGHISRRLASATR